MGWPRRLVLVRHGQSKGNLLSAEQRAVLEVSTPDYDLTERGRQQAVITGAYLRERYPEGFDSVFSSYYKRARQTAELMFPEACIKEDAGLAEANRGIWHTMTEEQVALRFPEEVERKRREGLYHYRPLGGENHPDIEQRIKVFLLTLCQTCEGENVCVVGHGHLFVSFQRVLDHITIDESLRRYRGDHFDNASVTIYKLRIERHRARLVLSEEKIVPWHGKL